MPTIAYMSLLSDSENIETLQGPDLQGKALWDYYKKGKNALYMYTSYGPKEKMPLQAFFADPESNELEYIALNLCKAPVLDIGAGAGRFSLALQEQNKEVTALEYSALSCTLMQERGVQSVVNADFWTHQGKYSTLLLMMNGIGLVQYVEHLPQFFEKLKSLLLPGGAIILDSSNISYLYDDEFPKPVDGYYGELQYAYEYEGVKGNSFNWLFLDWETLQAEAKKSGLKAELIYGPVSHQYLAALTVV